MKYLRLKNFLTAYGIIAIILTLTPFIALDYWWVRMFDFPHLQLTFLTFFAILIYVIRFDFKQWRDYLFISLLVSCAIYQSIKIFPYTTFADFEVLNSEKGKTNLKLYTSNVLQKNDAYEKLFSQIKNYKADILLLTETNIKWKNKIESVIDAKYQYSVEFPLDNTYGMLLYSNLKLFDTQVKFLVSDSVPSIHSKFKLTSNDTIQLYAIHPTPPMPHENPLSTDRDAEMMMIAKLALESKYPVIVIGDFNDVAWSQSSKLFQKVSRLLDIRKGRGLFNTYNADSFLLRWPLDHIFISSDFKLKHIERCEDIGSDHFPLMTELTFEPEDKAKQQLPHPSKDDLETAQNQIDKYLESLKENTNN